MPVLGAVLTLTAEPEARQAAMEALRTDPRIVVGDPSGPRLPVVVETATREEDRAVWEALGGLPGVLLVEVAFADFSDLVSCAEEEV